MNLIHERCAGLDVHKDSVVACVRVSGVEPEVRTFGTTTESLLALADWLRDRQVTHAVMESTGPYWTPVWHILNEEEIELVLANAEHVRNVPGRKTDVKDAMWLADLLAHGLVTASFVPPTEIRDLRDLTRTRRQLVRQRVQHVQRVQKTLESANIKLDSVISDIVGASGRAILDALVSGQSDPERLVLLANSRIKAAPEALKQALHGRVRDHHRNLLKLHLQQIDATNAGIAELDKEIERSLEPFRSQVEQLTSIPGIGDNVARTLIAEIGVNMKQFPSSAHLVSWAGLCPGLKESAGKRQSTRIRKGAPWLKPVLVQAAWSAIRKKDCYYRALFSRIKSRRGPKKAIVAVAAALLTSAYHILADGTFYEELGNNFLDRIDRVKKSKGLVGKLNKLGYDVTLKDLAA
jgi:transposase